MNACILRYKIFTIVCNDQNENSLTFALGQEEDSPDIEFGASHECSDVAVSKSLTILIFKAAINLSAIISQFTAAQHWIQWTILWLHSALNLGLFSEIETGDDQ